MSDDFQLGDGLGDDNLFDDGQGDGTNLMPKAPAEAEPPSQAAIEAAADRLFGRTAEEMFRSNPSQAPKVATTHRIDEALKDASAFEVARSGQFTYAELAQRADELKADSVSWDSEPTDANVLRMKLAMARDTAEKFEPKAPPALQFPDDEGKSETILEIEDLSRAELNAIVEATKSGTFSELPKHLKPLARKLTQGSV